MKPRALQVTELIERQFGDLDRREPGYDLLFLGEKKEAADSMKGMRHAYLDCAGCYLFHPRFPV